MNKRFLEAMAGALAGGTYGAVTAVASEPSVRKRNKEVIRKGITGAVVGGITAPALNTLILKNLDKIRAASPSIMTGSRAVNPENYFMGGVRALKQGFEKKADYVYNNKPYAAPTLAREIQRQLRTDSMSDEEVQNLVSDFSSKMGDPGNVVVNRGKRVYGGKYIEHSGDTPKKLKNIELRPGGNVVSEPLRNLLVNTMAHGVDPDKDKTVSRVKNLDLARKGLAGAALVAGLAKVLPTLATGYTALNMKRGLPVPSLVPRLIATMANPKVDGARKIVKKLLAGGALAAHVARSHELYKANQRANEVVKAYSGLTDEDVENDPVLYNKLKKHYADRNMKVLSYLKNQSIDLPNPFSDIPVEEE